MAIPSWKIFPALVAGNTVVFKPASDAPTSGLVNNAIEARKYGVVNVVTRGGERMGEVLAAHPDVRVVSFMGSSGVGARIGEIDGRTYKKVSLKWKVTTR